MINLELYCDGGVRANGQAGLKIGAIGFTIYDNTKEIFSFAKPIQGMAITNNEAEYLALLEGLNYCKAAGLRQFKVISDSQLVVNHVTMRWAAKEERLRVLRNKVWEIIQEERWEVLFEWHSRTDKYLQRVDKLCNLAMDSVSDGPR